MNSPLVSTEQLAAHLREWIVVDCRHSLQNAEAGESEYRAGHIPGARFLHLDRDLSGAPDGQNGRHPLPSVAAFVATLERIGVAPERKVVAYDGCEGMFAARLWWMLRWLGHDQVAVLEGGWAHWLGQGRPVETRVPPAHPATFQARPQAGLVVDTDYVLAHLHDPGLCLVDARGADRFRGENETLDPAGGHIPGARNRPFRDNLEPDGRFKAPARLKAEFETLLAGMDPRQVVHQCGSGVTACHNLLAMEQAGLTGGRLYAGSWSAWCADSRRPVALGTS